MKPSSVFFMFFTFWRRGVTLTFPIQFDLRNDFPLALLNDSFEFKMLSHATWLQLKYFCIFPVTINTSVPFTSACS